MNGTPKALRVHIALLGRRNTGKSSLLNALTGQEISIVSDTPGTTTDPVEKIMEMAPLGPVVFLDTAGIDDEGELGGQRAERSLNILQRTDAALIVTDRDFLGKHEARLVEILGRMNIPFALVRNKIDENGPAPLKTDMDRERPDDLDPAVPFIPASAHDGSGIAAIRATLAHLLSETAERHPPLLNDLLPDTGVVSLVVPIDAGAPKGRLILPQVQAIRDSLDGRKICLVSTHTELSAALDRLRTAPDLVVCDSQVVHEVDRLVPKHIPMTTFSILMARFKGDLAALARGAAALQGLEPGDSVLIQEACSHHPGQDDIGRVKLPRLLQRLAGGDLRISMAAGKEFSTHLPPCKAMVHCGGCVITRRQMLARQHAAASAGCPMTNYGLAISLAQGVLPRVLAPFPDALRAYGEAGGKLAS